MLKVHSFRSNLTRKYILEVPNFSINAYLCKFVAYLVIWIQPFRPVVEGAMRLHQLVNKNLFIIYYYLYLFADNSNITTLYFLFFCFLDSHKSNRN